MTLPHIAVDVGIRAVDVSPSARGASGLAASGNLPKVWALALHYRGNGDLKCSANQGRRVSHSEPMRCDHCRKSFGLILHRYFRMRFCSADCLSAYQRRLDDLTMIKIQSLDQASAPPR